MTRIKRFNESNDFRHNRKSIEEIEDYFLEFIQSGDLIFYHSGIPIGQNYVAIYFILDRKFNTISDSDSMIRLTQILKRISDVCKRWNLDWEFKMIAIGNKPGGGGPMQSQLEIRQPVPQEILYNFPSMNNSDIQLQFEGRNYRFMKSLKQDDQLNFYMICEPYTSRDGSGTNGKWLRADRVHFNYYDEQIVKQIESESSIPCEYQGKAIAKQGDLHYGQQQFAYKFKLLV